MDNLIKLESYSESKRKLIKLSDLVQCETKKPIKNIDLTNVKSEKFREEIYDYLLYHSKRKNLTEKGFMKSYFITIRKLVHSGRIDNLSTLSDISLANWMGLYTPDNCKYYYKMIKDYIKERENRNNGFNSDIWYLDDFNIDEKRNNPSIRRFFFDFEEIDSEENKKQIKNYIKYLITNTELSMITINAKKRNLKEFSNELKEKTFMETNKNDVEIIFTKFSEDKEDSYYNAILYDCFSFFEYLLIHKEIKLNCIDNNTLRKKENYEYKTTRVDEYVSNQIFSKLNQIKEPYDIMYLLIFCVGMRVSEVCILTIDCLEKVNNNYFINFFNQKMQKYVSNIIPENLYFIVKDYISRTEFSNEYLFTGEYADHKPMFTTVLRSILNKEFKRLDIKTKEGKYFKFRPHDYRHTLASQMLRADIPFQYIQRQLHHQSPEMTFVYVEYDNLRKIEKIDEFININGEKIEELNNEFLERDLSKAEWARKHINAQMLPNGVCARPVKLGGCPHSNSCLSCRDFRTSKEFLPEHKKQLKNINNIIEISKENGWLPQIETNLKTKRVIEKIIETLEVK